MSERTTTQPVPITDLHTRLTDLLANFGGTRDEVARTLFDAGRLGVPGECGNCPVAVHLLAELGLYDVAVGGVWVSAWRAFGEGVIDVDTPEPVAEFIDAFDRRQYPLLVKDEVAA